MVRIYALRPAAFRVPIYQGSRLLTTPAIPRVPLWLGGHSVTQSSGGTLVHRHSKTQQESCEVVLAGEQEIKLATQQSRESFETWRNVSGWERRSILRKLLSLLPERQSQVTNAVRADAAFSDLLLHADMESSLNLIDGSTETAISLEGSIPQTTDMSLSMVLREPRGPILSIPAFNFPLTLAIRSIVYPLACGNTVIMKGSPLVPQLSNVLGPLFADAGLPAGALQILHFSEDTVAEGVSQLIADANVRMVNFTGSTQLGRQLAKLCGDHLKPCVMELGGKAPAIVLPSANLELAANNILFGAFVNSGQVCMSTERVIVHASVAEVFEEVIKKVAAKNAWRGGLELVRAGAAEKAKTLVEEAVGMGARVVYSALDDPDNTSHSATSYPPSILADVPPQATLYNTESFAPLISIQSATDIPSIVAIANSQETGLSSSVFSEDLGSALEIARQLDIGAIHINGMTVHDQHGLPHGGIKNSGWGRFNGKGAIESFTQTKVIRINRQAGPLPLGALYSGL